jgi:hypothetical protein
MDMVAEELLLAYSKAAADEFVVEVVYDDDHISLGGLLSGKRGREIGRKSRPDFGRSPST